MPQENNINNMVGNICCIIVAVSAGGATSGGAGASVGCAIGIIGAYLCSLVSSSNNSPNQPSVAAYTIVNTTEIPMGTVVRSTDEIPQSELNASLEENRKDSISINILSLDDDTQAKHWQTMINVPTAVKVSEMIR